MGYLTHDEFFEVARKCGAIPARMVRYMKEKLGIVITRQAVSERLRKYPEETEDIREETVDISEEGLMDIIRTCKNPKVKLDAIKYHLDNQGKNRGYNTKEQAPAKIEVEIKDRED